MNTFDEFLDFLDKVPDNIIRRGEIVATRIVAHVVDRAAVNAPIWKDVLRPNIVGIVNDQEVARPNTQPILPNHLPNVTETKSTVNSSAVSEDDPTFDYAVYQHENLNPAGNLQLGERSAAQPSTPEGGVGGKYIQRVVDYHGQMYTEWIAEALGEIGK